MCLNNEALRFTLPKIAKLAYGKHKGPIQQSQSNKIQKLWATGSIFNVSPNEGYPLALTQSVPGRYIAPHNSRT